MSYRGKVSVTPPGEEATGPAVHTDIDVLEDAISFVSGSGSPYSLALVDVDDVFDDDYTLRLTDLTGRRYDFSMLGRAYGQVAADVKKRRNQVLQHDLL